MMRFYLLLILLSVSLGNSLCFSAPKVTSGPAAITSPPSPPAELLRRDIVTTLGTYLIGFGSICAYENGDTSSPIGCYDTAYTECALSILPSTTTGSVVCCSAGYCASGYSSCIASTDVIASCDAACQADTQILKCTTTDGIYCHEGIFPSLGIVNLYCASTSYPDIGTLSLADAYSTSLLLSTIIVSSAAPSTTASAAPSVSPSAAPSTSSSDSASAAAPTVSSTSSQIVTPSLLSTSSLLASPSQKTSSVTSAATTTNQPRQTTSPSSPTTDLSSSILSVLQTGVPVTAQDDAAAACFLNSAYTAYYSTPSWYINLPPAEQSYLLSANAGNTAACIASISSSPPSSSSTAAVSTTTTPAATTPTPTGVFSIFPGLTTPTPTPTLTPTPTPSSNTTAAGSAGLSSNAKIGVGVGSSVGGVALVAIAAVWAAKAGFFTGVLGGTAAGATAGGGSGTAAAGAGTTTTSAAAGGGGGATGGSNVAQFSGVMGDPTGGAGAHAGWSGFMGQGAGAGAGAGLGATPAAPGALGASTVPAATGGFGAGAGAANVGAVGGGGAGLGAANMGSVGAGAAGYGAAGSMPAAQAAGFGVGEAGAAGWGALGAGVGGGALAGMAMAGGARRMGSGGSERDGNSSASGRNEFARRPVGAGGGSSAQYSPSQQSSGDGGQYTLPRGSGFDYRAEMAAGGIRHAESNDGYMDPYQPPGGDPRYSPPHGSSQYGPPPLGNPQYSPPQGSPQYGQPESTGRAWRPDPRYG